MTQRRIRPVLAGLGLGTLILGTPTVAQWLVFERDRPFPFVAMLFPLCLMAATAGGVSALRRWGQRERVAAWAVVLLASLFSGVVVGSLGAAYYAITRALPGMEPFGKGQGLARVVFDGFTTGPFAACVWAFVFEMPRAIQSARDRERERQELLREAERARVRATLEPHFVLNSLNAIAGLVGEEPETARQLIGDLGDLLRDAVRLAERATHTAAEEIAWIERYARVLEARHPGRLVVDCRVDPAAGAMELPVLLLQPLVENAIQHGALQRPGGGRVRVEASRGQGRLRCVIEDDGPGMPERIRPGAHGLDLMRRRLAAEAPGSSMETTSGPGGTRIALTIEGAR